MKELLNNQIVEGILVTLICALMFWIFKWERFKLDEKKILTFLKASKSKTEYLFRSEPAISSDTNLSEDRVHKVCAKSNKIKRNQKEKKSWRLSSKN